MADKYKAPFGTYTPVAGVIGATAAGQVVTVKTQLKAFLNAPKGSSQSKPDFDEISPATMQLILGEIDGAFAAVAAAPTS